MLQEDDGKAINVMSSLDNVAQQFASLVPEGESKTIVRDNVGKLDAFLI